MSKDKEFRPLKYPGVRENRYLISNYGDVYSLISKRCLKPFTTKDGYKRICLCKTDGGHKNFSIHRLVAWEFVDGYNESEGVIIPNHLDTNPGNNYYKNLEWTTHSGNAIHGENIGRRNNRGEGNVTNVHSEDLVIKICEMLQNSHHVMYIMKYFIGDGSRESHKSLYKLICDLRYRKTWSHITERYSYTLDSTSQYNEKFIREIYDHLHTGKTIKEIMKIYGYEKKNDNKSLYNIIWDVKSGRRSVSTNDVVGKNVQRLSPEGL